jgi:BlaI family penicillinase repressor
MEKKIGSLTPKEEEIMRIVWKCGKAFVKDIRAAMPNPKPHITTIATVVRKLVKKGYLHFEDFGSVHRFYPLVMKEEYMKLKLSPQMASLFGNSYKDVVAFFAQEENVTPDDLRDIIQMIEQGK